MQDCGLGTQGWNRYSYVGNRAVSATDPSGFECRYAWYEALVVFPAFTYSFSYSADGGTRVSSSLIEDYQVWQYDYIVCDTDEEARDFVLPTRLGGPAPDPEPTDGRGLRPPTENPAFPPPRTGYGPNYMCAPYHTTSFSGANGEDNECVLPLKSETVISETATTVTVTCSYEGYCARALRYDPSVDGFIAEGSLLIRDINVSRKK